MYAIELNKYNYTCNQINCDSQNSITVKINTARSVY